MAGAGGLPCRRLPVAGAGGRSVLFSADVACEILVRRARLIYSFDVGVPLAIGSFSEPITDIFALEVCRALYNKQNCTKIQFVMMTWKK